jgi:hypothetical protein
MDPYLTTVLVARNDGHAGDFLHRLNICLDTLAALATRHDLSVEFLIVEWNPPSDRPRLAEVIRIPEELGPVSVRIVEVPPEAHERLPNAEQMPIFQFIGKNAGIRRARGEFVLATNADIILNDELMSYLSRRPLEHGSFYRIDKYDVEEAAHSGHAVVPLDASIDEQLDYCIKNTVWINRIDGQYRVDGGLMTLLTHKTKETALRLMDSPTNIGEAINRMKIKNRFRRRHPPSSVYDLHYGGSGDFIILSKDDWLDLRGFPELTTQYHGDAYTCVKAAAAGYDENILNPPMRIYHQEHPTGHSDRPRTEWRELVSWSREALTAAPTDPTRFNETDNWGLTDENLSERTVEPAEA